MIMGDEAVINQIQSIQHHSMDVSNVTSTTVLPQDIQSLLPQKCSFYMSNKKEKDYCSNTKRNITRISNTDERNQCSKIARRITI